MRRRFPLAALSPFSAYQTKTIRTALSVPLSKFNSFSTQTKTSSKCQEPDISENFLTSLNEDDDFSELGEPMIENGFSSLKLMTEKHSRQKGNRRAPSKDVSPTKPINEKGFKNVLSVLGKLPKYADTNPGEPGVASRTNKNTQDRSRNKRQGVLQGGMEILNSVTVENVPTSVSLPILGGELQNATIKIVGLSYDTRLDMIHSFLQSVGCLEDMAIKKWGDVQAVYRVKVDSDLKDVLNKLNGAIIDKCRISAEVLHSDDKSAAKLSERNKNKMGWQVSGHLKKLHNQLNLHSLYAEDLYNLHNAIMHLESHSGTSTHD